MASLIRRNLTIKILLAFSLAVLVGIGGVAVLANVSTRSAFVSYLTFDQPVLAQRLAEAAAQTYRRTGSWDEVGRAVARVPPPIYRVVIADGSGRVVVDTGHAWLGQPSASLPLHQGTLVGEPSQVYGTLFLASVPEARGPRPRGPIGRPFGIGAPSSDQRLSDAETIFLTRVNQSVILAALGGILVAVVVGGILARQITRPLREVTRAAQRIARGRLDERIAVGGEDEVGELARAFNQMAESLQQNEEARRHLVADVAHELRTPLTVIGGTIQAMRDGVLPPDETNLVAIQDEVRALTRLVSDLRDLSLADVGQFAVQREVIDLRRPLEAVAAAFAAPASARGIRLDLDLPARPLVVSGDEARLRQCFQNLVDNALRYTPDGGRVILRAESGPPVAVEIADTGAGVAPEHLPHLFERFYRADPSRDRRSGGSGLGLAIVHQIVQAHGGQVSAWSAGLGDGTTFHIELPASRAAGTSALPAAVAGPAS